ncbi:ATP-binding cassette domain-containing protein [Oleidesulfovibrio sp.]|uniref:ABC transporter ATP-binding protein n=1 Tax=Oleidesulfovibrio sp. TaxID=2909707 RepID=UPI003A88C95D
MNALIECRDLRHSYGEKAVLHGLSFSVERGGVFGLLGKNGAGKSTTINILMGFLRPGSGSCRVLGEPSHALTPAARARIGLLHEGFIQYDFMSIDELERYYAPFYPKWDRDVFYELVNRLNVPNTRRISCMSCGQRSQVVLGLIMAQQPELMILDDYSMGLDVGYRRLFIDFLREYVKDRGTTVLLTSHVVQELDKIVDNMIVLQEGRVAVSGSKKEFMESFRCYSFTRTEAADALHADDLLQNVEHMGSTTTVYTFTEEAALRQHLKRFGVEAENLTMMPMDFEDAFIGLTGKY